jgi:hypothetical protein
VLKSFIFRYYLSIALTGCLAVFVVAPIVQDPVNWKLIVTIVGGILSSIYFVQKQRLEELRLFEELFSGFNARYGQLNEKLNEIRGREPKERLLRDEINTLYDYFNLCGEEYLYYKHGYILPEVWQAWLNGMKIFYQDKRIKTLWEEELATNSYYGFNIDFLKKA